MKPLALVTGASKGIGAAISESLLKEGWQIYGIGRDFENCRLTDHPDFHAWTLDLMDTGALLDKVNSLPAESLSLLVNNAGLAWYGMHETISAKAIHAMTMVNLEVPMLLSQALLRPLRKNRGTIINIASVTAMHTSTHAACYGALKAALLHFSRTLLEENRRHGLKVACIMPDMTDTELYRSADFACDQSEGACLYPADVAKAVMEVLHMRSGALISEIVLQPQIHRIRKKTAD